MANWYSDLQAALVAAVEAVWPDVTRIGLGVEISDENYANLFESGELSAPYAVLQLRPAASSEWGLAAVYEVQVTLLYISGNVSNAGQDGADTGLSTSDLVWEKLTDFQAFLLPPDGATFPPAFPNGFPNTVVPNSVTPRVDTDLSANAGFLKNQSEFLAGELDFTVLAGYRS